MSIRSDVITRLSEAVESSFIYVDEVYRMGDRSIADLLRDFCDSRGHPELFHVALDEIVPHIRHWRVKNDLDVKEVERRLTQERLCANANECSNAHAISG